MLESEAGYFVQEGIYDNCESDLLSTAYIQDANECLPRDAYRTYTYLASGVGFLTFRGLLIGISLVTCSSLAIGPLCSWRADNMSRHEKSARARMLTFGR